MDSYIELISENKYHDATNELKHCVPEDFSMSGDLNLLETFFPIMLPHPVNIFSNHF